MNYDFSQLNDKEFEHLANDLLSAFLNQRIERFKPGRDSGVDGRFFNSDDGEVILQCKHYLKTGYKGLIRVLKNEEQNKVNKLRPRRYILITSLPLSRRNKIEIKEIFEPYIKEGNDIFGQEDLNDLIGRYKSIEEKHYKLWITSATVLNRIISNAIKGRSEYEIEQIQKRSCKFVQTQAFEKALRILQDNRVLIITGEPGIGKTTLAENLCLYYTSINFEFIDIEESLSEAENIYTRGKKQLFYYDDFLGSNYFEAIENKKDSHIVQFIERVKSDKSKVFILTSRTNILNAGVSHSSIFSNKNIRRDEYLLRIGLSNKLDNAKILYNHIWFSDLQENLIDEIYKDMRYIKIIEHQNYNPRLIEFITDATRLDESVTENYWNFIESTLNNPKDIWGQCFKVQNNAFVRNLVILTVFNGGKITDDALKSSFVKLNTLESLNNPTHTSKDYNSTTTLAVKSFLLRHINKNKVFYTLFNPSISDYVLSEYCADTEKVINIFKSLRTTESLKQLISLGADGVLNKKVMLRLTDAVFEEGVKEHSNYDYKIITSDIVQKDRSKKDKIIFTLQQIIERPRQISELSRFLTMLKESFNELVIDNFDFLFLLIGNGDISPHEIKQIASLVEVYEIKNRNIKTMLIEKTQHEIAIELKSARYDVFDISEYVDIQNTIEFGLIIDCNNAEIRSELYDASVYLFDEYEFKDISRNEIDFDSIVEQIDIDEMVTEYLESQEEPDYSEYRMNAVDSNQNIYDLFERG